MSPYLLEACVVLLGLILLMLEAFGPANRKDYLGITAIGGLVFCLVLVFIVGTAEIDPTKHPEMARFYTMDSAAVFFKGFAIVCTILVLLLSIDYKGILAKFTENPGSQEGTGEYYALPVFACAGMMWMASAKDLVSIFVALELVTITFYILVAFMRRNVGSLEAGVKYLILGALSTGFLVYGIAWIYGVTGTTDLSLMAERLSGLESSTPALFGLALILLALAFKIGAVPMQLWIPDVYQGAPTPTTAFLSVGSKAAGSSSPSASSLHSSIPSHRCRIKQPSSSSSSAASPSSTETSPPFPRPTSSASSRIPRSPMRDSSFSRSRLGTNKAAIPA